MWSSPSPCRLPRRCAPRSATAPASTRPLAVARILAAAEIPAEARDRIAETARRLVTAVRRERLGKGGIDALSARIRAVLAGGRGAAVPRRGAAAHTRRRDRRPADPRQARRGRLGAPSRPFRLGLCQRLDLGVDADREAAACAARSARSARRAAPLCRPLGRAGGAPGGDRGDAHPRPPVRHGAHHRGGARPRARGRAAGLPPFLRHARRGGAYRCRCGALSRRLSGRHRRDRRLRGGAAVGRGAGHLGQAVGLAPALRDGAARPRSGRDGPASAGAGVPGARCRHRLYDRRRGGRPPRSVARSDRGIGARPRPRRLGRARPCGPGLPEARPAVDRLARRSRPVAAGGG